MGIERKLEQKSKETDDYIQMVKITGLFLTEQMSMTNNILIIQCLIKQNDYAIMNYNYNDISWMSLSYLSCYMTGETLSYLSTY